MMRSTAASTSLKLEDYQAIAEFRYQIRRFLRFSEDAARAAGLEPRQHQLLLSIKGMPGAWSARISDLAERLQIQHHSAVELVDRLAARGLVNRALGEDDRREVYVQLSRRGESILRMLTLHHKKELRQLAPDLVATLNKVAGTRQPGSNHQSPQPKGRNRSSRVTSVSSRVAG